MDTIPFKEKREQMVCEQIIGRGISDKNVIEAFRRVPRHLFVSEKDRDFAYGDYPLSIGEGQTISQPYMVALMTQVLELQGNEKVLEVGTGSGYQAAILAELTREVFSVERIASLAKRAEAKLKKLGYQNIDIIVKDGTVGLEKQAPFDVILVTAGAPEFLEKLFEQVTEGGKMVVPVGNRFSQMLTLYIKKERKMTSRSVCSCVFVPLIGQFAWQESA